MKIIKVILCGDAMANLQHEGFTKDVDDFWDRKFTVREFLKFLKINDCHLDMDRNIIDNDPYYADEPWGYFKILGEGRE